TAIRAASYTQPPSGPVSTNPFPDEPPDFIAVASMNSTSPPDPVTARPVATPGVAGRAADSWKNFWRPSASRTASRSIFTGVWIAVADCAAAFLDLAPFAGFFSLVSAAASAAAESGGSSAALGAHLA